MEEVSELLQFLQINSRLDLKAVALTHVLSFTANSEGKNLLYTNIPLVGTILGLSQDKSDSIAKDACRALVNLSADAEGAEFLLTKFPSTREGTGIIQLAMKEIIDRDSFIADWFCMILSNISRHEHLVEGVIDVLDEKAENIIRLLNCFTQIEYNKKGAKLHYLGPIFCNITQHSRGRKLICNEKIALLQRILPFTHHEGSIVRRGGAVGLLKNICFDTSLHDWLLSSKVDVLPFILLPLTGPEEFTEEENDKLPIECQFMTPDKKREDDPDIRKMLLESLEQMCATRKGREYLRERGTYYILRELHKWENTENGDPQALIACENVVDILIRTETEIGHDNLKVVEIPEDLQKKFETLEDTQMQS